MTKSAIQPRSALPQATATAAGSPLSLEDPAGSLSQLRSLLEASGNLSGSTDLHSSERILSAFEQLVAEHRGMADELINVYEQLGIVFEVTRKLAAVQGGREEILLDLFVSSLRRSFASASAGREVCIARRGPNQQWTCATPTPGEPDQAFQTALCQAVQSVCNAPRARTAVVSVEPPGCAAPSDALIAPVYTGDVLVCAIVMVRRAMAWPTTGGPAFRASDVSLLESLATFCGDVIRNHRLVREMREMSIAMVRSLVSAVDQKDPYTSGHSLRVGYYATTLGRLLGQSDADLQMLQWSALLHDVGKIGIRDSVLQKTGKLTSEEFEHIKEHPVRSHRVVQQIPQLAGALDGILHHHERYDGSGYPAGLKAQEIPLQARIIQIADIFDALTSTRSYRPAHDWQEALAILQKEAGQSVDPVLQELFDRHIRQCMREGPEAWAKMTEKANHFTSTPRSDGTAGESLRLPIVKETGATP